MITILSASDYVSSSPWGKGAQTVNSLSEVLRRHAGDTFRRVSRTGCELTGSGVWSAEDIIREAPRTSGRYGNASRRRLYVKKDGTVVLSYVPRHGFHTVTEVWAPVTVPADVDVTWDYVADADAVVAADIAAVAGPDAVDSYVSAKIAGLLSPGDALTLSETDRLVENLRVALALGSSETFAENRLTGRYVVGGVVESFYLSADQNGSADVARAVEWVRAHAPVLRAGETFGIWHPGDGSVYVDVVRAYADADVAWNVARDAGERAIWDRVTLSEIYV